MTAKINKKNRMVSFELILTYFLVLVIGLGLIFDGYFFEYESLTINIVTGAFFLILLIYFFKKKIYLKYNFPFSIIAISLLIVNTIGLFFASDLKEAVNGILLLVNSLFVFIIALQIISEEKNVYIFLKGFYVFSIIIVALSLISFMFNDINIMNSFRSGRIYSPLGYANTAALTFIMAYFIGLLMINHKKENNFSYFFGNSLLLLTFIGTKSRGVFLIFPVLIVMYLFFIKKEERLNNIYFLLITLLPSIALAPIVFNNTGVRNLKDSIVSILGLFILFFLFYFISKYRIKINKKMLFSLLAVILSCLIITLVIDIFLLKQFNLFDIDIFNRFKKISLQERNVQERFIFMKDALKIFIDRPLFGVGEGGWAANYKQYRTFLYYTKEVHNHFIQVLVENGILGFIIFTGLWLLLAWNLNKKLIKERSIFNVVISVIVIALFLHSLIDFNLSYPLFYMLMWIFFAFSLGKEDLKQISLVSKQGYKLYAAFLIVSFIFLINCSLLVGWNYEKDGINHVKNMDISNAIINLEKSKLFSPINSNAISKLSQLYFYKGINNNDNLLIEKALSLNNLAIKYNKNNPEWYVVNTKYYLSIEEYQKAFKNTLQAISLAPLEEVIYYETSKMYLEIYEKNKNKDILKYLNYIFDLAKENTKNIDKKYLKWWHGKLPYSDRVKELELQLSGGN